ncbi:MAG: glycoside hydrolase family 30 protein [Clostridiaceae bacterium]|nr:glycoside hydrolase family 30 protein [Clostridiaceae bacterium]
MKNVKIIQTAKNTEDRLRSKRSFLKDTKNQGVTLKVNKEKTFQKIIGFGGAFTEAAAYTLYRMGPKKIEEVMERYFNEESGLGYSIGRVAIHSCDFALGNYTYVEAMDKELKTFNIAHEKKWVLPFLDAAKEERGKEILLLASPWSPPHWMKTNKEMNNGGKLLPEYMETWARYYAKYIKAMRAEGQNIWAITVQNEPASVQTWDSCIYTAEDEGNFVRDYLGPILQQEQLSDIKIYILDHNRDILVERTSQVLADPKTAKYVYGVANHWYMTEEFGELSRFHENYPDKHILFSEGCQEGGVHLCSWLTGERYGRNMIGDFNNWQEGWIDWNLILDETGGPNHVGNFCDAPIIADTKTQELHYNSSYYYIGHFSKYVKPGALRIEIKSSLETKLQQVGFLNPDGSVVLVVMNETDMDHSLNVALDNKFLSYTMLEHSIITLIISEEKK